MISIVKEESIQQPEDCHRGSRAYPGSTGNEAGIRFGLDALNLFVSVFLFSSGSGV